MSQSGLRKDILDLYAGSKREPPKEVLEASENDLFAWGMTFGPSGMGTAPLHKIGAKVNGVFYFFGRPAFPTKGATVDPILEAQYRAMPSPEVTLYPCLAGVPLTKEELEHEGHRPAS